MPHVCASLASVPGFCPPSLMFVTSFAVLLVGSLPLLSTRMSFALGSLGHLISVTCTCLDVASSVSTLANSPTSCMLHHGGYASVDYVFIS